MLYVLVRALVPSRGYVGAIFVWVYTAAALNMYSTGPLSCLECVVASAASGGLGRVSRVFRVGLVGRVGRPVVMLARGASVVSWRRAPVCP